jgi:alkylation response protein AidB-like acyl-CoA dehydrogenase
VDFRLDQDQLALQSAAKDFLRKEVPTTTVRQSFESPDGDAPELYKKMAELGWLGIAVPEDVGGLGMTAIEQAVVCEQLGYVDAPGPYFGTACLAIPGLVGIGATELLGALLDGSMRATVSWEAAAVVDGQIADAFIVVDDGKATWYERSEVDITPHASVDGTRRTATVEPRVPGRLLGRSTELEFGMEAGPARAADAMAVSLSAEMVGCMQWALDTTVQYVKDRQQFGKPIGSFQALKHRCADLAVAVDSAREAVHLATEVIDAGPAQAADVAAVAAAAKIKAGDAYLLAANETIQLHGGIGFTWEHDAHLFYKRALSSGQLLGTAVDHRARLAAELGV